MWARLKKWINMTFKYIFTLGEDGSPDQPSL